MKQLLSDLAKMTHNTGNLIEDINQLIKFYPVNNETIAVDGFISYIDAADANKLLPNGEVHFTIKNLITRFVVGSDEDRIDVYAKWDSGKWIFGVSVHPTMKKLPIWPVKIFPNSDDRKANGVELTVPFTNSIVERVI